MESGKRSDTFFHIKAIYIKFNIVGNSKSLIRIQSYSFYATKNEQSESQWLLQASLETTSFPQTPENKIAGICAKNLFSHLSDCRPLSVG